jgi:hypothetical protein
MSIIPGFNYRKIVKGVLYCLYLGVIVLGLTEIAYRVQVIDFYSTELNLLNSENDLTSTKEKKTILVCGDSFTAQSGSWADQLRDSMPNYRIINSALTGTSIVETSHIAQGRIDSFDPDIFIYQIYVGNDLLGIRHQLNWNDWSAVRNIYWWLSDRIHVLAYFNYRMGQWRWRFSPTNGTSGNHREPATEEKFELDHYSQREKLYAKGDPFLISNSVLLKNKRDEDMDYLLSSLNKVISKVRSDCRIYLLVIPHKAQINTSYLSNMNEVGFRFDPSFAPGSENYPFIEKLKSHFLTNANVDVLNPLAPLAQRDSASEKVYFLNDEHLSKAGQSIINELVMNRLSALNGF